MFIDSLRRYKMKSIFLKFFITFFLLIILPVAVSNITAYTNTRSLLQAEAVNSYAILAENMKTALDQRLNDTYQAVVELSNSSEVKYIASRKTIDDTELPWNIILLSQKMRSIKLAQGIVDDIFIYFRNIQKVYYQGTYDRDKFFADYFGAYLPETWNTIFGFDLRNNTSIAALKKDEIIKRRVVIFTPPFYIDEREDPKVQIIIPINEEHVTAFLKGSDMIKQGRILIFNEMGDMLFTLGDNSVHENTQVFLNCPVGENKVIAINGQQHLVHRTEGFRGLQYVSVVPASVIFAKIEYMKNIIIRDFVFLFILGLILSFAFSYWMYKPIQSIIRYIENRQDFSMEIFHGELGFIKSNLVNLYKEVKNLMVEADRNVPVYQERFTYHLIRGLVKNQNELQEWTEKAGVTYLYKYFCVVCIRIDAASYAVDSESLLYKSRCLDSIKSLANLSIDLMAVQVDDNTIAVIVNMPGDAENEITLFTECIKAIMEPSMDNVHLFVGVGNRVNDIFKIHDSYRMAEEALLYRKVGSKYEVIEHQWIKNKEYHIYYPEEQENVIIHALLAGNTDAAVGAFNKILLRNFESDLPYVLVKSLVNQCQNTFMKVIDKVENGKNSIFSNIQPFLIHNREIGEIAGIRENIQSICSEIGRYVHDQQESNSTTQQITQWIEEHLGEDIYLEIIASRFNFTPCYFSKYFKDHFGINYLDYLNKSRIKRAKELLRFTNEEIQEIAEKVGFRSRNTLTRTFKKYEGVSPSIFREIDSIDIA